MRKKDYVKQDYYNWGLRPDNNIENLRKIWGNHDWDKNPNEWIPSQEWYDSFLKHKIIPLLNKRSTILEIGCGDGRWSKSLVPLAKKLILVDIVPYCIHKCKRAFAEFNHIDFHVNDGKDLSFVEPTSIDFVFSLDCFIQINSKDTLDYLYEFSRVLNKGGKGLIQHSKYGETMFAWRSDNTKEKMHKFCKQVGLEVIQQYNSWENGKYELWPGEDIDTITVFRKL